MPASRDQLTDVLQVEVEIEVSEARRLRALEDESTLPG